MSQQPPGVALHMRKYLFPTKTFNLLPVLLFSFFWASYIVTAYIRVLSVNLALVIPHFTRKLLLPIFRTGNA